MGKKKIKQKKINTYYGEQHFEPIKYFGGNKTFNRIKNVII